MAKVEEILGHHFPSHVAEAVDAEIRRRFPVRLERAHMLPPAERRPRGESVRAERGPGPMALPAHANVVIVGGGIAGCSIAYHLTQASASPTSCCSSAGNSPAAPPGMRPGWSGQLRATRNLTELAKYTADLYHSLEAETGQATGFKQNGSISVAKTPARLEELKRGASMGKTFGLRIDVLTPGEIKERWPLLEVGDLVGGIFLPKDGQTNPIDTTQALAKGAKQRGARIFENTTVERIRVENGPRRRRRNRRRVTSRPTPWCCAPACGRTAWRRDCRRGRAAARRRAFLHRHRADRRPAAATCRCCACRTNAPTTRKTPASC